MATPLDELDVLRYPEHLDHRRPNSPEGRSVHDDIGVPDGIEVDLRTDR